MSQTDAAPAGTQSRWAARARGALTRYRVMAYVTGTMLLLLCAELIVHYAVGAGDDFAIDLDHIFRTYFFGHAKSFGAVGVEHQLRQACIVAQVDEQQAAVVAFAVDPAREADGFTDLGFRQGATGVTAIEVHSVRPWVTREILRDAVEPTRTKPLGKCMEDGDLSKPVQASENAPLPARRIIQILTVKNHFRARGRWTTTLLIIGI